MLRDCGGFGVESKFDKRFNFVWNFVMTGVVIVFIAVAVLWSVAIFGIFKGAKEVKQRGLKHVIEEVWNGQDAK